MNNEIKEILIFIENKIYPKDSLLFEKWSFLKDYITNLQQDEIIDNIKKYLKKFENDSETGGIDVKYALKILNNEKVE